MKFITAACSINSKTKNRDNSTTLIILFILSLLLINTMLYFLEVFNAVELELASWSSLKLTFQIKHALLPSDSLIINNHNMTDNSVKKQFCCVELEIIKLKTLDSGRFVDFHNCYKLLSPWTLPTQHVFPKICAYPNNKYVIYGPELKPCIRVNAS